MWNFNLVQFQLLWSFSNKFYCMGYKHLANQMLHIILCSWEGNRGKCDLRSWHQSVCKHSLTVSAIQKRACGLLSPRRIPWCHSSPHRFALPNGLGEITSKPSEDCVLTESDTHTQHSHIPTCMRRRTTSHAQRTGSRLSTLPADITFLWSAPCFRLARALFGLSWAMSWAGLKVILLKGGTGKGNLEL